MTKSVTASGYTVPIREPVTNISNESFLLRFLSMTFLQHFTSTPEAINLYMSK